MSYSVNNAPLVEPNVMSQYAMKTSNKPLCFTLTKHDKHDDGFFIGKIEELANGKLKLFVRELKKGKELKKKEGTFKRRVLSVKKNVPKKVVGNDIVLVSNEVTERLKLFIADEMKGSDIKLVIQKSLFKSDLDKDLNRLNIPINQLVTDDFVTTDEKEFLESNVKHEKEVRVLGPRLRMYEDTMGLKIWNMKKTKNYVLIGNWSNFVKENKNDLKVKTKIQVWSFRKDQELCLAIACVDISANENIVELD